MKKYVKLVVAAAVLLCGLVLTGCGDNNPFLAPKETWFRREIKYTSNSDSSQFTTLYAYFCYSDDGFTPKNSSVALDPGLTVVVTTKSNIDATAIIAELTATKYIKKTFSNTTNTVVGSDGGDAEGTQTKSFRMTYSKWCWMYNLIRMEEQDGTITPLRDDGNYSELTDLSHFSWKKIMADYLLDTLLQ